MVASIQIQYEKVRASTGSKSSPWGFVGLLGYLTDIAKRLYVRARHYRPTVGQWQTVDPLWPRMKVYGYVRNSSVGYVDPSGLAEPIWDWFWGTLNPPNLLHPSCPEPAPWKHPGEPIRETPSLDWLSHLGMVREWNYFNWGWGNCCGLSLKCGPGKSNGSCLDNSCERHDKCVGTDYKQGYDNWSKCDASLCQDPKKCYRKNDCGSQSTSSDECQNTWEAAKFFCGQATPSQTFP